MISYLRSVNNCKLKINEEVKLNVMYVAVFILTAFNFKLGLSIKRQIFPIMLVQEKKNATSNIIQIDTRTTKYRLQACDVKQLLQIESALLPDRCIKSQRTPWYHRCSFTIATRCMYRSWLEEYYAGISEQIAHERLFLGLCVGCQRFDAVNVMRAWTNNEVFDKDKWRETLQKLSKNTEEKLWDGEFMKFNCISNQTDVNMKPKRIGEMHWLGSPNQMNGFIEQSARLLDLDTHGLKIVNVTGLDKTGEENTAEVILGNYTRTAIGVGKQVNFLKIDLRGNDFDILLSMKENVLKQTEYLEFSYFWTDSWAEQSLKDAIMMLYKKSFTCYFAGEHRLWKITGCWQHYYEYRHWANIACVSRRVEGLRAIMEDIFQRTLQEGKVFDYGKVR